LICFFGGLLLKEIALKTSKRCELKDITQNVGRLLVGSGVKDGLCVIYCPHTTAGLLINENADPDVKTDLLNALEALVPALKFKHSEGNSDAHLKSSLVGKSLTLIVRDGKLVLGTWDAIYFAEFDGPRNRKVLIKVIEA